MQSKSKPSLPSVLREFAQELVEFKRLVESSISDLSNIVDVAVRSPGTIGATMALERVHHPAPEDDEERLLVCAYCRGAILGPYVGMVEELSFQGTQYHRCMIGHVHEECADAYEARWMLKKQADR